MLLVVFMMFWQLQWHKELMIQLFNHQNQSLWDSRVSSYSKRRPLALDPMAKCVEQSVTTSSVPPKLSMKLSLIQQWCNTCLEDMHEHRLPIRRFEQECKFLNTIRHPNIIQYLGMYRDPDSGLPVLLMELMDESLTHFLERIRSIPYHIQVNLLHDIALALAFLHANGIVHRDLSGNNVLMISNVRAKVTDFGMAKLDDLNPRMSHLTFTMCPGTDVYMPPEAVQDQPVYTEKIDCFSFGVIVIQMLTRQFPKPDNRMQKVEVNHPGLPRGTLIICIPEVDRRKNHISQVNPSNILLPIALDCLKDRDVERPSAQQLCERLAALTKCDNMYAESIATHEMTITQSDLQSLKEEHTREIQNLQESQLREQVRLVAAKDHEIQELLQTRDEIIAVKKQECEQLRIQLEQIQCRVNEKEQVIEELGRQLKQVHLDLSPNLRDHTQLGIESDDTEKYPDIQTVTVKLSWRKGKPAPQKMYRWCNAVVDETMVYFNASGDGSIYCYNTSSYLWTRLAECPCLRSSFAVVNKKLTSIGGFKDGYSNKLYSLEEGESWVEEFPPMPTKRASATAVRTESSLIVVGGEFKGEKLCCPVEVMSIVS